MKPSTALILALASSASSVWAEGRSGAMLALLKRLPVEVIDPVPGAWTEIQFVDHLAAAASVPATAHGADDAGPSGVYVRVGMRALAPSLAAGLQGGWEPLVGFGPTDIKAHLSVAQPPEAAMLLHLDPAAAARVVPALLASGYEEEAREGVTALTRGEDLRMDLAARNPADPFGGAMGAASRVLVEGSLVVQANSWPSLLRIVGSEGLWGHPDLAPMAGVIDRPDWGDVALVEATAMPHQLDLSLAGGGGIPPWQLGLLADLSSSTGSLTLALFSYASESDATAAAERIHQGWHEAPAASPMEDLQGEPSSGTAPPTGRSLADITGAEVEAGVAGEGPFAAWAALRAPSPGGPADQVYEKLLQALYARELTLFGVP